MWSGEAKTGEKNERGGKGEGDETEMPVVYCENKVAPLPLPPFLA